jgi:hypothetical protein
MDSMLRNILKATSSPHDIASTHLASKQLFFARCGVCYIKDIKFHMDWRLIENG